MRQFRDASKTVFTLTTLPPKSPSMPSRVLVWRRVGKELVRHCVVASSATLSTALNKRERGLFAWGEHVDWGTCVGMYSGQEQIFASEAEVGAACARIDELKHEYSYHMRCYRGGRWLLVDAREPHDAFLRYVNTPVGLGLAENAHIQRDGSITANEQIPSYNLALSDAENACAEIWAEYC